MSAHLAQLFTSGWRALEELRSHGLVRAVGAGINELGMMPRFLDMLDIDFFLVALRYTLLEQETLEAELPYCERRNVGMVIGGRLQLRHNRDRRYRRRQIQLPGRDAGDHGTRPQDQAVCKAHSVPLAAAALQFPLGHRRSPRSSRARSTRTRCARTSRISATQSPPRYGRT